jgi:predicted O-methyltransferase YrrM
MSKGTGPILEVGSWLGLSASALTLEGIVFCVDTFHGGAGMEERFVLPEFAQNIDSVGRLSNVVIVPMSSMVALSYLDSLELKFKAAFLDADHSYDAVAGDLIDIWELLERGGVLVLDDYVGGWPGVKKATDEFLLTMGLKIDAGMEKMVRILKP